MRRKSVLHPVWLLSLGPIFMPTLSLGQSAPSEFSPAQAFAGEIKPLLARYCVGCHGDAKPKAGLNLKGVSDDGAILKDRKLWGRLVEYVEAGEMPPEGKDQPTGAEVERLTQAIGSILAQ